MVGKELFENLIKERKKRTQTATAVWVCMLLLAVFCCVQGSIFGVILGVFGALLAVLNVLSYGKLGKCMAPVEGLDAFYKELDQAYVSQDGKVFVLENYAVLAQTEVMILPFKDMKKVEVGLQGQVKKTLFLTDERGNRYQVCSSTKGDGSQEEFDKIYYLLRDKVK